MNEQNSATHLVRDRSEAQTALDNLVRRKLRVSDPHDPELVARALMERFPAEKLAQFWEIEGFPHCPMPVAATLPAAGGSSQAEVEQAVTDVKRDLTTLKTNSLLKDIQPELNGWEAAINAAVADGINAARQSLDPRQRDLAFASRRLLGDYARIARFVGALTPNMSIYYRRLAQSLDEVAAVVLVLMGEALANIGFAGGRFILQVATAELQERRDAVIFALRNLIGSVQEGYGPQEWPRGMASYRELMDRLTESGHSDLKALIQENNLARVMDDLINRGSGGTAEGMRQLGATGQLALEGLRRLVVFGKGALGPASPPLSAFLNAVELFLDAFEHGAGGSRMLFIARPPAVFYGLYGIGGPDDATRLLLELVIQRGKLAEKLDCYLGCDCHRHRVLCQILLDKILYDIDRAIDFYARGTDPGGKGEPEHRAAAYGYIIEAVIERHKGELPLLSCFAISPKIPPINPNALRSGCEELIKDYPLYLHLQLIKNTLWHECYKVADYKSNNTVLCDGFEAKLNELIPKPSDSGSQAGEDVPFWERVKIFQQCLNNYTDDYPNDFQRVLDAREDMRHELCLQLAAEEQWRQLLLTMAPSCIRFHRGQIIPTQEIIEHALSLMYLDKTECPKPEIPMPGTGEESLERISATLTEPIQVVCKKPQPRSARIEKPCKDSSSGEEPRAGDAPTGIDESGEDNTQGTKPEGGTSVKKKPGGGTSKGKK